MTNSYSTPTPLPRSALTLRLALHDNLYEPVPVDGKRAVADGWSKGKMTPERIHADAVAHPRATNTGLRTGRLVGVDIDVTDPGEVEAIKGLAGRILGPSAFIRIGQKGMMICYQNLEPIRKIKVCGTDRTQVEILGLGQQFVAYGTHPETGQPYKWPNAGSEPAEQPADFLPEVTPERLREFATAVAELLTATHPKVRVTGDVGERPTAPVNGVAPLGPPLPPEQIHDRLYCCNPGCDRDEWRSVAAGLHATPCTDPEFDKRALFVEWSRGGENYTDDGACEVIFEDMAPKDDGTGIGAGTFIRMTDAAGYRGPTAGRNDQSAAEVFHAYLATLAANDRPSRALMPPGDEWASRVASFRGREPDEDAALPEPEFWDDDSTLPKFPDGSIGVAYGQSGAGKTTVILSVIMAAIQSRGARVAFLAGEGAYGLGKMRIPAQCAAHGIAPVDLRGKYRTIPRVPNLNDKGDVNALIEAQRDFSPNIVVVDTMATALPGADENAAATGSLLTGNGPAGHLSRAFNAAVIFVAHSGKDASKGPRGSSSFSGNVDFVWEITTDKAAGTARLHVRKMRDGPDGFSVYFQIDKASNGVPIARRIREAEYKVIHRDDAAGERRIVYDALRKLTPSGPTTTDVLATELVCRAKDEDDEIYKARLKNKKEWLTSRTRVDKKSGRQGAFANYVLRGDDGEPLKPMMWKLPDTEGGDSEDEG